MVYNSGHVEDQKVQIGSLVPVAAVALSQVRSQGSIALSLNSSLYISAEKAHPSSCRLAHVDVSESINGSRNERGPELENVNAKVQNFVESLRAYWSKTTSALSVNYLKLRLVQ